MKIPIERLRNVPWDSLVPIAEQLRSEIGAVLGGEAAERVIDRFFHRHRFDAATRHAAAEVIFGVGMWQRRLGRQMGYLDWQEVDPRVLLFAFLSEMAGTSLERASAIAGVNGSELASRRTTPISLADAYSLPDWLADLIASELGADAPAFAEAINSPGPICLRTNLLRCSRPELIDRLAREGVEVELARFSPVGLIARRRFNVLGCAAHRDGWFEVQDEGSQLLGSLVEPEGPVLDLCAGAGGKTLQLAAQLQNRGVVYAFDPDREKLDRLSRRAAKAGASNLSIVWGELPSDLRVDQVLVDAPCSSLGALRRGPDLRFRIDPKTFLDLPRLQKEILDRAATYLRPGGRIVYATCTVRRQENEEVVERFLAEHSDFQLRPIQSGPLPSEVIDQGFLRTFPHRHRTDGFFGAVLQMV